MKKIDEIANKYYEEYAKTFLNIPFVSFEGLNREVACEILEALNIIFKKYPALKDTICSIGYTDIIKEQENLIRNANEKEEICWYDSETTCFLSVNYLYRERIKHQKIEFIAIEYGMFLLNKSLKTLNHVAFKDATYGYRPKDSLLFRFSLYHEIGHILDIILNLEKDPNLFLIIKKHSYDFHKKTIISSISRYPLEYYSFDKMMRELIAEAFTEYMINPKANLLVNEIGSYIDKKYKRFEKSSSFKINQTYWAVTRRAEKGNSKTKCKLGHKILNLTK